MKKITLLTILMAFFVSSSVFAARYLVQNGGVGDATWRAAGVNETVVDLTVAAKTFDAWHSSTVSNSDTVWVAKGTYVLTASLTMKSGEQLYGGFIGTEVAVSERVKGTNAWDFTNATTLDGDNAFVIFNNSAALASATLIDGFTVTKGKNASTGYNMSGSGAKLNGNTTMQNCIVSYCVSEYTSGTGGGGVGLNAGSSLINSYIHHNTSATAKNCGGVYMFAGSTMTGCTIDSNAAPANCGGVYLFNNSGDGVAPILENCIISNNTAGTGTGGGLMAYTSAIAKKFTTQVVITGCTFSGNSTTTTSGGGIYLNDAFSTYGYVFNNCAIENNTSKTNGGGVFSNAGKSVIFNKCVIKKNNSTTTGSAIYSVTPITLTNCIVAENKGVDFMNVSSAGTATLQNCTFAANKNAALEAVGMNFPLSTSASTITNCIFYNASAAPIVSAVDPIVSYCGFESGAKPTYATNSIETILSTSFADVVNGDWHLVLGSSAVNAGTTIAAITTDIEGTLRPQGAAYDMGAYELTTSTALNLTNDFNYKIQVNSISKSILIDAPAQSNIRIFQMNGGVVSLANNTSGSLVVNTSTYNKGVYMVEITSNEKRVVQKIIL
ncbi:MAG: right-handed parallel beta-helix repeat-containing protein [Bacteroidales bacterium]